MKVRGPNFAIKLLRLNEDSGFLTVEEAAAYLRINTRTLYKLAKQGSVPARRVGGSWHFSRAALENFIRNRDQSLPVGFK